MDKKKIKEELNDIRVELTYIIGMINDVSNQMQELQQTIRKSSNKDEELPVREFYEHPWYKYKRKELIAGGNYNGYEEKRKSSECDI